MNTKKWYESKTLWINAAAIAFIIFQYATNKHLIGDEEQAMFIALFNLVNRFFTTQALEK